MSADIQVCYTRFDETFFKLPQAVRAQIESKIDDLGTRLAAFQHHRLTGSNRYRLRVGDYRIIHTVDLLAVGHRREIYRNVP